MTGALEGIRVVDFTERVQGPFATQILGDLGADVVKIERIEALTPDGRPDERYNLDPTEASLYRATFLANNRNKRSLAVNIKTPEGRATVLDLIAQADVVYENFRPGVMTRLGLGFDACKEVNPDVIYVDASGYGVEGPYLNRPGQDVLVQALSGMGQMNIAASGRPQPVGMSITDILGGLYGAIGVVAALLHRQRGGVGQRVSVDLLGSAVAALSEHLVHFLNSGAGEPERATEMHGHGYIPPPYGFYKTQDGYIALSSGRQIPQICEILGIDNLAEDPRFDSFDKRLANRAEMESILEDALSRRTTEQWLTEMIPADIFVQPVNSFAQAVGNEQVVFRGLIESVTHPRGTVRLPRTPLVFSQSPATTRFAPPDHGEHTREVLEQLGMDAGTIDSLYEKGVVA